MLTIIIEHLSAAKVSSIFILLVIYGLLVLARSANMLINSLNIS
uniref:Androgen induced inhibitor of proliferation (As3) / pds5, putative n=1 Tax=Arundo donax TaxID=35708 RepID=A0A0A8Y7F2_ARUDO